MPSKDTAPEALPVVDGQPGPGSRPFGMPDEAVGSPDTTVWAYWQPLPNAYWDAGITVQQEVLGSALQQAWAALQTQLGLAGLQHVGTPRVRFSVEVDTEPQS